VLVTNDILIETRDNEYDNKNTVRVPGSGASILNRYYQKLEVEVLLVSDASGLSKDTEKTLSALLGSIPGKYHGTSGIH
jgi:hypothetical protein